MAEQPERQGWNSAEKLELLQNTIPYFCAHLVPSFILPRMGTIVTPELRADILEAEERSNRREAVKMLIDHVIEEGDRGLNVFLHAIGRDEIDPGWPRFLEVLLPEQETNDHNRAANQYYAFLLHLLEGDVIPHLTTGVLRGVMMHLWSKEMIGDEERESIRSRLERDGPRRASLLMFTLLGARSDQWPVHFFTALKNEAEVLVEKMVPYGVDPIVKTESELDGSGPEGDSSTGEKSQEETHPKSLLSLPVSDPDTLISNEDMETAGAVGGIDHQSTGGAHGPSFDLTERQRSRSGASTGNSSTDVYSSGFSDDEKNENEDMEKEEGAGQEQGPRELSLREYQLELAEDAERGMSTIICAPTGSGKTRVALHIVRQHLVAAKHQGRPCKVVFLARTVPLVSQQHDNFQKFLQQYKCKLVTGNSSESMTLHLHLDEVDILVMTPQVLVNHLVPTPQILENHLVPDKISSLTAFSLIIFDECHHTRKGEPYMSIMKHYLQSKKRRETGLPQIVGLTASIGVEKATTPQEALQSVLDIMANLDVSILSRVRRNLQELQALVPRPDEELDRLVSREDDDITNSIKNVMKKILKELPKRENAAQSNGQRQKTPQSNSQIEIEQLWSLVRKQPTDLKSQEFGQWANMIRKKVQLLHHPAEYQNEQQVGTRRELSWETPVLADWLVAYNEAFDVHDLTRPQDVIDFLTNKSKLRCVEGKVFHSSPLLDKIKDYYKDIIQKLDKLKQQQNPNLTKLRQVIERHISEAGEDPDAFRILVFVRTRATCQALCRWLNSGEAGGQLQSLQAQPFTGTGAQGELGGMTQFEQKETLKRFSEGSVKLLVTTSVGEEGIDIADCNLTIRYNHVGNEVTTVQTRGRSRKKGGRSILLAMPKIIEQEELNRRRMGLMYQALDLLDIMSDSDICKNITEVQRKVLEDDINHSNRQAKKPKTLQGQFSIACLQCKQVEINGDRIRKIKNTHHVIIGHDIDDRVVKMPGKTTLRKDDWEITGSVVCRCRAPLGKIFVYRRAKFISVCPKNWIFLDKNNAQVDYKKWTKVPYPIDDISVEEIQEQLGIAHDPDNDSLNDSEEEMLLG